MKRGTIITWAVVAALIVIAFLIAGCGGPKSEPGNAGGYTPGMTYDSEDYVGPAQQVAGHAYEEAVKEPKTKKECDKYKAGKPRTSANCTKWKQVPDGFKITDDEDWYLILADSTRVDVDQDEQARYPVGSMYP